LPLPTLVMKKLIGPVGAAAAGGGVVWQAVNNATAVADRTRVRVLRMRAIS
jgi:hypothetical protein